MDWQQRPRCDETAVWPRLVAHFRQRFAGPRAFDLRQAFAQDARRFERFSLEAPPLLADLSKQLLDEPAQQLLTELARECRVEAHRDAMLAGERINTSERRAVTHVHWRWVSDQGLAPVEQAPAAIKNVASVIPEAAAVQADMLAFAEAVRANPGITDVVNIGIGGSDLGPRLAVQALRAAGQTSGPRLHFVANMDGHELAELLPRLSADRTLFIIVSKTFGTAETLRNAQSARDWVLARGGADVARHFVAVSAHPAAARAFGAGRCFGFDDGVGGRFSLWSPVGLAIAIAIGGAGFQALLAGARALDRHFAEAPLARNLPVQLALLDLWCRNFLGLASRCVAPYHHGLRQLPAYQAVPIVYLSSETDIGLQIEALRLGGDQFLTKPFNPVVLAATVKTKIERHREMLRSSHNDGLTGLLNHTAAKTRLDAMVATLPADGQLSVAMLDIDHFKSVNDTYGHPVGDQVIRSLAWLLKGRLRSTDLIGRYGGEEFIVALADVGPDEAWVVLDRIRRDFAKLPHTHVDGTMRASFSAGIAAFPEYRTPTELTHMADMALLEAKRSGRDRVERADVLPPRRGSFG